MRSILARNRSANLRLWIVAGTCLLGLATSAVANFEPMFSPTLEIKKAAAAIKIDGSVDDAEWQNAGRADSFVERYPGDNTEPEVRTETFVTYDDHNLYIGFICHDDPAEIRASMTQRDQFHGDDAVGVLIDTYGDAAWGYELYVNPYGIQKDFLWSSISGDDPGFDLIWESAGRITQSGYQVEIAVPFASMRFPNKDVQSWKVDFRRNRPRDSYKEYSWAAYDRNEKCIPCQFGTFNGISNVRPGRGFEIMPTVVANQSGSLRIPGDPGSPFDNADPEGEISVGAKYSVSSDITVEGSYNPDFSQVEADAAQIDVNTTIALFYPERRPFFQEGSDIFRTIFNSFYTRTVNDPQFAVKLTGRMNRLSVGFLSARDENTPYIIPLEERSIIRNTGESYVNVLRASRTFGGDNHLGFIVTDRRMEPEGSGTIVAVDGDLRLSRNYSVVGQYVKSHTKEPIDSSLSVGLENVKFDHDKYNAALDGESYSGDAFVCQFRRRARHLNFTVNYDHVAPSYRTETGYDPWSDYRNLTVYSNYIFYFEKGIFERISPALYADRRWNFDSEEKWTHINLGFDSNLKFAQTYFSARYGTGKESWGGIQFDNLWSAEMNIGSRLSDQVGYDLYFNRGRGVARWLLVEGNETSLFGALNLKPIDRLIIEPTISYARSTNSETGEELYSGYIARARVLYQANRELSLRFVVQFNDFSRKWEFDPLLTYRVSTFSLFYIGSTYDYDDLAVNPADPDNWKLTSRQFFMKLQYLFRT